MPKVIRLILVSGLLLSAASCSDAKKAQLPPSSVESEKKPALATKPSPTPKPSPTLKPAKEISQIRLIGQVSSQDKILLAFKVAALISHISVKTGSKVSKGQVIAQVDDASFLLREAAAQFQLERAENLLAQATRDYDIEKDLRSKDISSVAQFQDAELAYKNAVVAKKLAQVELSGRRDDLGYTRLKAPADGVVSRQIKFVGDQSTGGDAGGAIFEMFALGNPEVYLNAPESLLARLTIDTPLEIHFPAIGLSLPAKLVRIVPVIREEDRTFVVIAKLVETNSKIVPGLFAEGLVNETRK